MDVDGRQYAVLSSEAAVCTYVAIQVSSTYDPYMSSFCSLNFFLVGAFRRVGFMYVYLQSHLGLNFLI